MSQVEVQFTGDIKDLQSKTKQAIKTVASFSDAQKKLEGSTNRLNNASGKGGRSLGQVSDATRKAQFAMQNLNRVVQDAPFGFIAIQNNIDQALSSFGALVTSTGSARGALKALATSFTGVGGIITVVSLASSAYIAFGDDIKNAFNKGKQAAEEAKRAFSDALSEFIKVDQSFEEVSFSRSNLIKAITETERAIESLKASNDVDFRGGVGNINLGASLGGGERSDDINKAVSANKTLLEQEETTLKLLKEQLDVVNAKFRANQRIISLGAASSVNVNNSDISIDGGDELVDPIDRAVLEDLKLFEQRRIDLIKANQELANTFDQVTAAIERENNALFAQREAQEAKSLQDEISINNANRLANASRNASIQAENVGQLIAVELGQEAAAGLADVVLGFENLKSVLGGIKESLRGIVREIAAAAAKAALLSIFFPGASQAAGGFKGLFRGALGLTPFAKGGIVTGPTPALVGEAGPEAIIPLDRLSSMGMSDNITVQGRLVGAGEDLLLSLRSVNTGRNGRGGRINI